jgi:hypothetical protein
MTTQSEQLLKEFDKQFGTIGKFQNSKYADFKQFLLSKVKEAREEGFIAGQRNILKQFLKGCKQFEQEEQI